MADDRTPPRALRAASLDDDDAFADDERDVDLDDDADDLDDDDGDDDSDDDPDDEDPEDADDLDDEFPLGDGAADGAAVAHCPYCGEPVEILLDAGGGDLQEYVEDCEVCCRPWRVRVRYGRDGAADVELRAMDE